ncbi:MAG: FAD:protein FMN transferase [Blastocatellia bacterium]
MLKHCEAMGTRFEALLVGNDQEHMDAVAVAVIEEIIRLDGVLSRFDPRSEIARMNREAVHAPVRVDREVFALLERCEQARRSTDGFFDVTASPHPPGESPALRLDVEICAVQFTGPSAAIDLGGVGKGYALDRGREIMLRFGATCGVLHGGQMDVVNWFLGAHPKRVFASSGIDYYRDGRESLDNISCLYEYEMSPPNQKPYIVRVSYTSLCNNAYEGAAELIMGAKGSLYLTSAKGLLFQEKVADAVPWEGGKDKAAADANAAVVTAGKTLKLSNDPWAHRGAPFEIDIEEGNDTRDELVSFIDDVRRRDPKTIADAAVGVADCATILIANQSVETGGWVEFPM